MKKLGAILTCVGIFILFAIAVGIGIIGSGEREDNNCRIYFSADVQVKDGRVILDGEETGGAAAEAATVEDETTEAETAGGETAKKSEKEAVRVISLLVQKDSVYGVRVGWSANQGEEPGVLTVFTLRDVEGNAVLNMSADQTDSDFDAQELKAGEYTMEYRYFTDERLLRDYLTEIGEDVAKEPRGSFHGFEQFGKEGMWQFDYSFELVEQVPADQEWNWYAIGMLCGVGIVVVILLVLLIATKKDGKLKGKYDERQEIYRGRAFKYAFFTMLIYYMAVSMCEVGQIALPMEPAAELTMGVWIALIPFVCYSIWNDAYFSLNERKKTLMVVFGLIGVLNLVIGIINILDGRAVVAGKLTYDGVSLLLGIDMCVILATVVVKSLLDREEESE